MEIIWKTSKNKYGLGQERMVDLEYAVRLEVVKILIKKAEHLMDYLSLIVVEIDAYTGQVTVHDETPQPLFSIVSDNLGQPKTEKVAKKTSPFFVTPMS
ncbi:hypothetical protein [Flagellimonas crocea]|uniref:hypothetical protein n=1 Tax=Flagellimonas crocea TaxID=3067311 RepID=UPI00296E3044|nr:hypothetical protein [Muricauda sp. DH64]